MKRDVDLTARDWPPLDVDGRALTPQEMMELELWQYLDLVPNGARSIPAPTPNQLEARRINQEISDRLYDPRDADSSRMQEPRVA